MGKSKTKFRLWRRALSCFSAPQTTSNGVETVSKSSKQPTNPSEQAKTHPRLESLQGRPQLERDSNDALIAYLGNKQLDRGASGGSALLHAAHGSISVTCDDSPTHTNLHAEATPHLASNSPPPHHLSIETGSSSTPTTSLPSLTVQYHYKQQSSDFEDAAIALQAVHDDHHNQPYISTPPLSVISLPMATPPATTAPSTVAPSSEADATTASLSIITPEDSHDLSCTSGKDHLGSSNLLLYFNVAATAIDSPLTSNSTIRITASEPYVGGGGGGLLRSASLSSSSVSLRVGRRRTAVVILPVEGIDGDSSFEPLSTVEREGFTERRHAAVIHRKLSAVFDGHHVHLNKIKQQMGDVREPPDGLLSLMARKVFSQQGIMTRVNSEGVISGMDAMSSFQTPSPHIHMDTLSVPSSLPKIRTRVASASTTAH